MFWTEVFFNNMLMAISRAKKGEILQDLKGKMEKCKSAVIVSYRGTTVKDVDAFRSAAYKEGLNYKVAKKKLVMLAAKEAINLEIEEDVFKGVPFGIVFGFEDQISSCKVSANFTKDVETADILGGIIDGEVVTKDVVMQYATLPSREELLAKFIGIAKAPLQGFAGALSGSISGFARSVSEYAKQKEANAS